MKNLGRDFMLSAKLMLFVMSLFCVTTFAQKVKPEDVPQAVKTNFSTEFPNAKVKEWQSAGDKFVVLYKDDGATQKTYLTKAGEVVETKISISKQELPGFINDYLAVEYPSSDVTISELVQKPKEKDTYYIALKRLGVGTGLVSEVVFSSEGKVVSRKDPEGYVAPKKEEPKPVAEASKPKSAAKPAKKETAEEGEVSEPKAKEKSSVKTKSKSNQYPENIVSENSVPPIVKKNFAKKFPKTLEVKWYNKSGDSIFVTKCMFKEQKNEIHYAASGRWILQRIILDEKTLFPAVQKYLDKTYRKYQFVSGLKTLAADKNDGFEVKIIELKNKKKKLETTIVFDKMGKLIRTIDPEYSYEDVGEKETATDRKLENEYNKTATNVDDDNNSGQKVTEKELPTDVTSYIYSNYPGMKIKEAFLREIDELGMCYEVSVSREGINQEVVPLVFDKTGKFLKNANDVANSDEPSKTSPSQKNVYTPADTVLTAFKAKHPKANKTVWEELNEGDIAYVVASFTDGTGAHKSFFTADGSWVKFTTAMSPETVSANIKTYIEKNHKGYKIIGARNVKKADKKTYYEVDIQQKKTSDTQTIEFNQAGKPSDGK